MVTVIRMSILPIGTTHNRAGERSIGKRPVTRSGIEMQM